MFGAVPDVPSIGADLLVVAIAALLVGPAAALIVRYVARRILEEAGVEQSVEGTVFDRLIRRLGLSTIGFFAILPALFVYALTVMVALNTTQLLRTELSASATALFPNVFVAVVFVVVGLIAGDKAGLMLEERLKGVKLPQVTIVADGVKWSIFSLAVLLGLAQIGIATLPLVVVLAGYLFALVVFGAVAFRVPLSAAAAGVYLLLSEPYSIGDEVVVDDHRGIVQEVDLFVTHVERDTEEYIVPNHRVLRSGIVRVRK
ncbi:MAG: mechanosensitive ion channel domain-containing protein [Halococcoides sp.]